MEELIERYVLCNDVSSLEDAEAIRSEFYAYWDRFQSQFDSSRAIIGEQSQETT